MKDSDCSALREKLGSRLGFLMLAAGCAVGLGNVWRFPFIVGQNGGAAFVILYFCFLVLFGLPLLISELSVGRASGRGISGALKSLALKNKKLWWIAGIIIFSGNILLMLYYSDVGGWLLCFADSYARIGCPPEFSAMLKDTSLCTTYMCIGVALSTAVCALGVRNGVERITKRMMISLLVLVVALAAKALTLDGAAKGLEFYLKPDFGKIAENPVKSVFEAMGQAFFTLSVGVGCMTIFGSYTSKKESLVKEGAFIVLIDTFIAIVAGLIIFPTCATFNVAVDSGPGLIFEALPKVFSAMEGGRIWGTLFFLFLTLGALTTIIAVFECIIGGLSDEFYLKRSKVAVFVGAVVMAGSLPTILFPGVLEMEDFIFSQFYLPLGALAVCIFVSRDAGWGFSNFRREASEGRGFSLPSCAAVHFKWIIPVLIALIVLGGAIM